MQLLLPFQLNTEQDGVRPLAHQRAVVQALGRLQPQDNLTGLRITGADGTGKTTLLKAWAKVQNVPYFGTDWLDLPEGNMLVLDDITAYNAVQQQQVFHWYNAHRLEPAVLLVASDVALQDAEGFLPDLRSRLLTLPAVELPLPDEVDLDGLLEQWAQERQVDLDVKVRAYMLTHLGRDPAALKACFEGVDVYALQQRRGITVPLVQEYLKVY